jgi:hypothetical protein
MAALSLDEQECRRAETRWTLRGLFSCRKSWRSFVGVTLLATRADLLLRFRQVIVNIVLATEIHR